MIFDTKDDEKEYITIKVNNQDLICEKNKYTRYYPSGAIQEIKVCKEEQIQQHQNDKNVSVITKYNIPQPITFVINGEKQILELTGKINLYENGDVEYCHFTTKSDRIIVNIAEKKQSIKIKKNDFTEENYCHFHINGNLLSTQLQDEPQQLKLEIGNIKQTLDVKRRIELYDNGKLEECFMSQPQNIECYVNGKKVVIKLDNYFDKKTGFFEDIFDGISFFSDGTLKKATICEDIDLIVKFHGKDYNLPFKNGDEIIFNDNKELSQSCIDKSSERSAIVYAERLDKLEKSQAKTNQEVRELQNHQKVATWGDWLFVGLCIIISFGLFYFACFHKPLIGDPVSFVRKNPDINKYVFLFEILKRTPIIVLLLASFKFLQLAFERLRLIGEVEKVQKYIKLASNENAKDKLLAIIAVPFFTHKKQKQPLLNRLYDNIRMNIDKDNNEKSNKTEN